MIPRIFEGEACGIIAGGPSLIGHIDIMSAYLRNLNTIAINRAYEFFPHAKVLWWTDALFWRHHRDGLLAHEAKHKATTDVSYRDTDFVPRSIHIYRFTGPHGFEPNPNFLRHGNNSTYAAIHLAAHLGAKLIVIFGLDMKHGPRGVTHFHGGYGREHREQTLTETMMPFFQSLKKPLAKMGVTVLNASPESRLDVWPRVSIIEGLRCIPRFSMSKTLLIEPLEARTSRDTATAN